jgi:hypothetical protein
VVDSGCDAGHDPASRDGLNVLNEFALGIAIQCVRGVSEVFGE